MGTIEEQQKFINNHDTITVDDFNDIQQLFGVSLVRNGDSIGLHEFNSGIYEQVVDVVRDDFWNKLFANITYIEGDADFNGSKITDLGNLQSIKGDAYFRNSQITSLGNLQSIKCNAFFRDSQITSLGNLQSIGYADFDEGQVVEANNLKTINGKSVEGNPHIKRSEEEEDRLKLYMQAINKYGCNNQLTVAIEEMSELQKEICKIIRGEENYKSVIEEIADVEIMLEQIKFMYHIKPNLIENVKVEKLNRLRTKLSHEKD